VGGAPPSRARRLAGAWRERGAQRAHCRTGPLAGLSLRAPGLSHRCCRALRTSSPARSGARPCAKRGRRRLRRREAGPAQVVEGLGAPSPSRGVGGRDTRSGVGPVVGLSISASSSRFWVHVGGKQAQPSLEGRPGGTVFWSLLVDCGPRGARTAEDIAFTVACSTCTYSTSKRRIFRSGRLPCPGSSLPHATGTTAKAIPVRLDGMARTAVTAVVMILLAAGKARPAAALDNRVLRDERRVTFVDGVLASAKLVDLVLNGALIGSGISWRTKSNLRFEVDSAPGRLRGQRRRRPPPLRRVRRQAARKRHQPDECRAEQAELPDVRKPEDRTLKDDRSRWRRDGPCYLPPV
jgi:hypothetical protein